VTICKGAYALDFLSVSLDTHIFLIVKEMRQKLMMEWQRTL
jgi:hypothetical protein